MPIMMQFLEDTQVAGRYFPRGGQVSVVPVGSSGLILPNPEAHTSVCLVPIHKLAPLRRYRVRLINRLVGLLSEREVFGINVSEMIARIGRNSPDCEVVDVTELD